MIGKTIKYANTIHKVTEVDLQEYNGLHILQITAISDGGAVGFLQYSSTYYGPENKLTTVHRNWVMLTHKNLKEVLGYATV